MPHPSSLRFHEVLQELGALHDLKQKDYGTDEDPFENVRSARDFGVSPALGAFIRMHDKVTRLKAFSVKGELHNESVEDNLRDIAVYAVIALVILEEEAATTQELQTAIGELAESFEVTFRVKDATVTPAEHRAAVAVEEAEEDEYIVREDLGPAAVAAGVAESHTYTRAELEEMTTEELKQIAERYKRGSV